MFYKFLDGNEYTVKYGKNIFTEIYFTEFKFH